jgi:hypothetical protein
MTDEATAPGGGEPIAVITPAADTGENLSISQAARALQAARKPKEPAPVEQPQADPVEQPELAQANAGPAEEQPIGEDAPVVDPAEAQPIEPPRSWTKEAKEQWQALPRNTQEYLAQREQERDREVRRSQNEAAEKLKGLSAKEQEVERVKHQYEAQLPALMQTLQDAQAGQFADVRTVDDVQKLAAEDPFRYLQWQAHQTKVQAVNAELQRVRGEASQAEQSQWAKHVQKENELVAEYIPELADKTKAAELTARAVEHLHDLGFKDEELADLSNGKTKLSIYDHRIQRLLFNNLKLADIQKAKTAAVAKPVPPVQRPGVSKPSGSGASEQIQALTQKLNNSGSLKDAQALRAAQMRAGQRRAS